jgi:AcrR family transcriptional regulator
MRNTRENLLEGVVRIVAEGGAGAARMRAIAREAGVTEAAIYKHYPSKEVLIASAYRRIVDRMVAEKKQLVEAGLPFRRTVATWIELTFAFHDANPEAFRYVLLTPGIRPDGRGELDEGQGRLFLEVLTRAMAAGEIPAADPRLALCLFTGLMLNVPRMIHEGTLPGPATDYTESVTQAVLRVLDSDSPRT